MPNMNPNTPATNAVVHAVDVLRQNLAQLDERDQRFARSLIGQWERAGWLSDSQRHWVAKLGQKATTPREAAPVGDLGPMLTLFARAREHLKNPAITFGSEAGAVRLSVAGARSRYPGSINVTTPGSFYGRVWYGRIHTDGAYEASSRGEQPAGLVENLRAFAADPAGQAARHGHLTGSCCFCNRPLSDERSTAVGYGQTCAGHYGLPWGVR